MIKNLLIKTLLLVNVVIILAMLLTGFACMLDPVRWGWLSMAGYVFPIPLALNMLMIAVWVFVKFRYVLVPVAGMLVCYVPVTTYTPVNLPTQDDGFGGGIRVMSYNTWGLSLNSDFGKEHGADEARRELFRYIRDQHPDIVCLQESFIKDYYQPDIDSLLTPTLPYSDTLTVNHDNSLALFSRYPILKKELIKYESKGNLTGAFTLDVEGRRVIVVNNHLETNSFSEEEKALFRDVVHGERDSLSIAEESRFFVGKLLAAARKRKPQADAVASYIRMHKDVPMIVCGDFNDIPLSYARYAIARELTDCYTAVGTGPGWSYRKNSMRVRIDNMLCSSHFTPKTCYVAQDVTLSDHYPIVATLKLKEKL